jgi:dUTP pyrophosphatase
MVSKPDRVVITGKGSIDMSSMILIRAMKFKCERATEKSAGYDLRISEDAGLLPGQIKVVSTGVWLEMPADVMAIVCSRSGLASRGIVVNNAPGIIDADYNHEVKVILMNQSDEPVSFTAGDKIAQLVFTKWLNAGDVVTFHREGGLGSTGDK